MITSREITMPWFFISRRSSSNSLYVSSTGSPSTYTIRFSLSSVTLPQVSRPSPAPPERRSSAFTREIISITPNGLVM